MNNLYLKAATEQALIDALPFARGIDLQGDPYWLSATNEFSLDIIGDLYNDDAVYSEELDERGRHVCISAPTKIPGFHANLRCNDRIRALIPEGVIIMPPPGRVQRQWA